MYIDKCKFPFLVEQDNSYKLNNSAELHGHFVSTAIHVLLEGERISARRED